MKKTVLALGSIAASFVANAATQTPTEPRQADPLALIQAWTGAKSISALHQENPVDIQQAQRIEENIMVADSSTKCCSSGTCDIYLNDGIDCNYPDSYPAALWTLFCAP